MCETVWIEDALLDCEQTAVGIGRVGICVALWNCANPDGKCVNEERKVLKVNTNPSSNVCSVSSNVSLLLKEFCTISLPFELEWKVCGWRFADAGVPQGSNNRPLGYPPVSTSSVGCCRDRFSIPLLHKCQRSVGRHLHCNFLSLTMLLMVVTSRQRQESDGSHCGVCRETHRAVIYALTPPSCLHVLIPGLTPGDKWAGYF